MSIQELLILSALLGMVVSLWRKKNGGKMGQLLHLNISTVAMCKNGDRVKCIRSRIDGREGRVYTVRTGNEPSKKDYERGHYHRDWLEHMECYGDRFEILTPQEDR